MIKTVRCYWCDRLIRSPSKRKRITLMGPAAHRVYEHRSACPPDLKADDDLLAAMCDAEELAT